MEKRSHFPVGMSLVLISILLSAFYFAAQAVFQSGFFFGFSLFPHEAIVVGLFGALLSIALFFGVLLRMKVAFGFLLGGIVVQGLNILVSVEKLMSNSAYGSYALFYWGCLIVCFLFVAVFFAYVIRRKGYFFEVEKKHHDRWFLWCVILFSLGFALIVFLGITAYGPSIDGRLESLESSVDDASVVDATNICEGNTGYFQDVCWNDLVISHYENVAVDYCDRIHSSHERFKCVLFFGLAKEDMTVCSRLQEVGQEIMCRAFVSGNEEECGLLPRSDRALCIELIKDI